MKEKKETELSAYVKERKGYLQQAFYITIFSAILPIAPIVYMRAIFGPVVNASSIELLLWLSFLLLLFLALGGILEFLRSRIFFSFIVSLFRVLEPRIFETAFKNSAIVSIGTVILSAIISTLAAYALTVLRTPFRYFIFLLMIMPILIPGISLLIPTYILIRKLGLMNSYLGLILMHSTGMLTL